MERENDKSSVRFVITSRDVVGRAVRRLSVFAYRVSSARGWR